MRLGKELATGIIEVTTVASKPAGEPSEIDDGEHQSFDELAGISLHPSEPGALIPSR